ncbi:AzlD domain-containing protein [Halomonas sp. McH1-25]|uniref:branched-chain amino acid transporter permease n=1 Tax=unclassified Halomonas TaxID=2609666 RepID=UPI001EF59FC3|nr:MULTISPECIES: AzlD domain-containing protein [unclassified Halomonas]MCG7598443.1 AzlD domain-containing protein [Halomonas sp. McH1-25]MCP1343779.1 AzlD domain-containing protein [Halomonas sp. FL8]MCP1361390.1 AzlD domain-containing protein [Halomonas sp. BBD45]MCP1367453.1 AzlD domain-containing protein [Halomonas sp. BBD48]
MSETMLLLVIAVCALATFATRVLPFVALSRHAEHPLILHLGKFLPPAVMLILVIYALRNFRPLAEGSLNGGENGLPLIVASISVAVLHVWRRNALLSIIGGTGLYMAMIQLGWFVPG